MAYTVYAEDDWICTGSPTYITPGGSITSLGTYQLWIDASGLLVANGSDGKPGDSIRVTIQTKANSGSATREIMAWYILEAGLDPPIWRSPDIDCGGEIVFTVMTIGNFQFWNTTKIPWKIYKAS